MANDLDDKSLILILEPERLYSSATKVTSSPTPVRCLFGVKPQLPPAYTGTDNPIASGRAALETESPQFGFASRCRFGKRSVLIVEYRKRILKMGAIKVVFLLYFDRYKFDPETPNSSTFRLPLHIQIKVLDITYIPIHFS